MKTLLPLRPCLSLGGVTESLKSFLKGYRGVRDCILRLCHGNTLSKKMADARSKGVLAPQDSPLAEALNRIGAWIEAERSASGDTHNAHPASREDGWFVVHVVGALIRRLAEGPRSG